MKPRKAARRRRRAGVRTEVVVSTEAIDVDAWIDQYLVLILEARGYVVPADLAA